MKHSKIILTTLIALLAFSPIKAQVLPSSHLTELGLVQYPVTFADSNCLHFDTLEQVAVMKWQRTWGGPDDDRPIHLAPALDGGWLVTGAYRSADGHPVSNFGQEDIWLLRTNSTGDLLWQKQLGSSGLDLPAACGMDGSGNVWLTGRAGSDDHTFAGLPVSGHDIFWANLDAEGHIENLHLLEGNRVNFAGPMVAYDDGMAFAVSSNSDAGDFDSNFGEYDAWVFRYDGGGNLLFKKNLSGSPLSTEDSDERIQAIARLPDGGLLVGGYREVDFDQNFWMLRLDEEGEVIWEKEIGGSLDDDVRSVLLLPNGNCLWAGFTDSQDGDVGPHSGGYTWLVMTDGGGEILWKKVVPAGIYFTKTVLATDDSFWLTGTIPGTPLTHEIIRFDFEGNQLERASLGPLTYLKGFEALPNGEGFAFLAEASEHQWGTLHLHGQKDFWFGKMGTPLPPATALGADTVACPGDQITLTAEVSGCDDCTFLWDDGSTDPVRTLTIDESHLASVVTTHPDGCKSVDHQLVRANEIRIEMFVTPTNCGEANGKIATETRYGTGPPGTAFSYMWSNGDSAHTLQNLPAGEYAVMVSDDLCGAENTATVGPTEAFQTTEWERWDNHFSEYKNLHELADGSIAGLLYVEAVYDSVPPGTYLRKFSSVGEMVWEKNLGFIGENFVPTPDGGFAVVGNVLDATWEHDFHLKKLGGSGELVWEKTYPAPGDQYAHSICLTPDGGFLLVGNAWAGGGSVPGQFGGTDSDAWLLKTDAGGEVVWSKIYGGSETDEVNSVIALPGGGYVVGGHSFSQDGTQTLDMPNGVWLFQINENGDLTWNTTLQRSYLPSEWPDYLLRLNDGGFLYGAHRFDVAGNPIWEKNYARDVVQLANGEFIAVDTWPESENLINITRDWLNGATYGLDHQGDTLWINHENTDHPQLHGYLIRQLSDGHFLVAGNHYVTVWTGQFPVPDYYAHFLKKWKAPQQLAENHPPDTLHACLEIPFPLETGNPTLPHFWDDGSQHETRWVDQPGSYSVEVGEVCTEVFHFEVIAAGAGCFEEITEEVTLCHGEAWQGQLLTADTLFTDTLYGVGGTRVVTYQVDVLPQVSHSFVDTLCIGSSYQIGGTTLNSPGEYAIVLENENGCDSLVNFTLEHFPPFSASAEIKFSCPPEFTDGSIDLTVMGGNDPFTFLWETGETTEDIAGLGLGFFRVTVTDGYDCARAFNIEVLSAPGMEHGFDFEQPCPGEATGMVAALPSGDGPFSFFWEMGDTSAILENLPAGLYPLTVTDGNGCISNAVFPLLDLPGIGVEFGLVPPSPGQSDGSIEVTSLTGEPPLLLTWHTGESGGEGLLLDSLATGIFTAFILDGNGCADTVEIYLGIPNGLSEMEGLSGFRLSPNPAPSAARLCFDLEKNMALTAGILDAHGRVLFTLFKNEHFAAGEHERAADMAGWPPGVYFVRLRSAEEAAVLRLVKMG